MQLQHIKLILDIIARLGELKVIGARDQIIETASKLAKQFDKPDTRLLLGGAGRIEIHSSNHSLQNH